MMLKMKRLVVRAADPRIIGATKSGRCTDICARGLEQRVKTKTPEKFPEITRNRHRVQGFGGRAPRLQVGDEKDHAWK